MDIQLILGCILLIMIANALINIIIPRKFTIKIKLPYNKDFETKKSPIYKITKDDTFDYVIIKYELQYHSIEFIDIILMFIIPIKFNILKYNYYEVGHLYISKTILSNLKISLKDYYEEIYEKWHKELFKEQIDKKQENNILKEKINDLNSEYNENN